MKPEVLEQAKVLALASVVVVVGVVFGAAVMEVGSWRSFNCNNDSAANSRYSG